MKLLPEIPRGHKELGSFIIRVGMGAIFMMHGYGKLMGGMESWTWLGSQMQHFGITFFPAVWGFAAAATEFFGGVLLIAGRWTRIAASLIACVMVIALVFHLQKGDGFKQYSHALSILIVMIGLAVRGD